MPRRLALPRPLTVTSIRWAWFLGLLTLWSARPVCAAQDASPDKVSESRAAAARSVELLQSSVRHWTREVDCFSCHHQGIGGLTLALTKELGFKSDPTLIAEEIAQVHSTERARFDALLVGDGVGVFGRSTVLLGLGVRDVPRDSVTDAVVSFLAARQTASGAWYSNEHRPPFEDNHVTASALTIRALSLYAPEGRAAEFTARIQKGKQWLQRAAPRDTEERTMRILGLAWAGASAEALAADCAALIEEQRSDGGWSQLPNMESDAYATGQALVVLHQAGGLHPEHEVYRRGVRFLLKDQRDDSSWLVKTRRRIKGNRPRYSGFPHNKHQFISFLASCWSTMALALSEVEPKRTRAFFGPAPPRKQEDPMLGQRGYGRLHRAAAYGSLQELHEALAGDIDVDGRGPRGVTPLMLAVHDLAKVELLIRHGADWNAESEWGFTPLLCATLVQGRADVVEHLLELGASVHCGGANGASPLMCAANVGDISTLDLLFDAGATFPPDQRTVSLIYAANCGDIPTARALLARDAELDGTVTRFPSALVSATISGYEDFVAFSIQAGADLESRDLEGMTALAWAAKIGQAHGPIMRRLLVAGADVNALDNQGKSPLDWAIQYRNQEAHELLLAHGARRGSELDAGLDDEAEATDDEPGEDHYKSSGLPGADSPTPIADEPGSEG